MTKITKIKQPLITSVLFFTLLFLFSACSTTPITNRSRLLITSVEEENSLGAKAWLQIEKKEKLSKNKTYIRAVKRVGQNIARVANRPDFKWEFKVFESKVPNAFCLPGGKVAVYSALFKYTDNDAELAAVMGHEIGHAIARHGGERISQQMLQGLGALGIMVALDDDEKNQALAIAAYQAVAQIGVMLPYSRLHEYEADHIGMILATKAGYSPQAVISFWRKFGKLGGNSEFSEYFSTHPLGSKRLIKMKELLREGEALYRKAPKKHGLGRIYKKKK
jgi:predicted Zn-dependent protease